MTQQERAESFLRKRTGLFFCAACLARELGIDASMGRRLVWTLQALPDHEMRGGRCVSCRRGKRVIRYVRDVCGAAAKGDVVAFLLENLEIALCDACVAFSTDHSLGDVRLVFDELTPFGEFRRREGICLVCSRTTSVTCAVIEEGTPADLRAVATGTEQYQGWRLDLLSYRVPEGWRPLVLIKAPTASLTPDAPSLLRGTCRSKSEADRHALQAAKEWVDKHFGA